MNDRQESKLSMYKVVVKVCNSNAAVHAKSPVFGACVNELATYADAIGQASGLQSKAPIKGATAEKASTGEWLIRACLTVSNPLYVLALKKGDITLMQKANINKNTLYTAHNSAMHTICKTIAAEAAGHAAELVQYGISAGDLAELDSAIAAYGEQIAGPRAAIIERTQQTGNLVQLFAAADSLLIDQMDKLIVPFKKTAAGFYTDYINARNIINTAARRKKENNNGGK